MYDREESLEAVITTVVVLALAPAVAGVLGMWDEQKEERRNNRWHERLRERQRKGDK